MGVASSMHWAAQQTVLIGLSVFAAVVCLHNLKMWVTVVGEDPGDNSLPDPVVLDELFRSIVLSLVVAIALAAWYHYRKVKYIKEHRKDEE